MYRLRKLTAFKLWIIACMCSISLIWLLNVQNLSIIKLNAVKLIKNTNNEPNFQEFSHESDELTTLLTFLMQRNAFLIDIEILKALNNSLALDLNNLVFNLNNFQYYFALKKPFITFGILNTTFDAFTSQELVNSVDLNCYVIEKYGLFLNKNVTTNVYIKCTHLTVQLAVFYKRGDFLWIGSNENNSDESPYFGDVPRAVQNVELEMMFDYLNNVLYIPKNIQKFLYDYEHSKFIECNRTLADSLQQTYAQNVDKSVKIVQSLKYLTLKLEEMYKNYWITSGTLLGWYRQCGVIPFTTDADVAMRLEDYDERIKKIFIGNKILRVYQTIGTPEEGFEIRYVNQYFTYDLFFLSSLNETHRFCGYYVNNLVYKGILRKFDNLCSAELYDTKFIVPCDPEGILIENYGASWYEPKQKNFQWPLFDMTNIRVHNDEEWSKLFVKYDKYGKILNEKDP